MPRLPPVTSATLPLSMPNSSRCLPRHFEYFLDVPGRVDLARVVLCECIFHGFPGDRSEVISLHPDVLQPRRQAESDHEAGERPRRIAVADSKGFRDERLAFRVALSVP